MKEIIKIIARENRIPALISQLVEVWERSVRETHLFLSDEGILQIKEYVPQALSEVANLLVAESEDGSPIGFMGDWKCCFWIPPCVAGVSAVSSCKEPSQATACAK